MSALCGQSGLSNWTISTRGRVVRRQGMQIPMLALGLQHDSGDSSFVQMCQGRVAQMVGGPPAGSCLDDYVGAAALGTDAGPLAGTVQIVYIQSKHLRRPSRCFVQHPPQRSPAKAPHTGGATAQNQAESGPPPGTGGPPHHRSDPPTNGAPPSMSESGSGNPSRSHDRVGSV